LGLFSGIGGFAIAADRVFGNVEHIFCEIDPFCQAVLKKHWPDSEIQKDIRNFDGKRFTGTVDLLTGGFPCQPFSCAGQRKGTEDSRHLWPEMLRIIREAKPSFIIGENVAGISTMAKQILNLKVESRTIARFDESDFYEGVLAREEVMLLNSICEDIEKEGYEVQPIIIPACAVNAPHRRDRVWIVAHSTDSGPEGLRRERQDSILQTACDPIRSGLSGNPRRRSGQEPENGFAQCEQDAADTKCLRQQRQGKQEKSCNTTEDRKRKTDWPYCGSEQFREWSRPWLEIATELCGVDDGLPAELDGLKLSKSKHRENRLKSLGNAIVPQVATIIMQEIKEFYA
jgi:DNA (cytosine-5)-methyltransferase 1